MTHDPMQPAQEPEHLQRLGAGPRRDRENHAARLPLLGKGDAACTVARPGLVDLRERTAATTSMASIYR
jgi:hypothetical protein